MDDTPADDAAARSNDAERSSRDSSLSGLMAVAIVRRLLLEQHGSESLEDASVTGERLEDWVVRPLADFAGLSPAQTLSRQGGLETVRAWLNAQNI